LNAFDLLPPNRSAPERVLTGTLECDECGEAVPILAGFPCFPERGPSEGFDHAGLRALGGRLFGDRDRLLALTQMKSRRPSRDRYAAFQPFNEATRAFLPLAPLLREELAPGDRILDLWCRTGWTGELLAALFPEQHVLSIWEGASDVLGYRGFGFWLGEQQRAPNLDVIFAPVGEPLPFRDASIALIHGCDTLHRYDHEVLVPEVLRVCDGAVIFPHVHLDNAEPSPYFDRGTPLLHGSDYVRRLERALGDSPRGVCVLSERDLAAAADGLRLENDANTRHYNALIAIVPTPLLGRRLRPEPPVAVDAPELRPIANPLVATDLHCGRTSFAADPDDDLTSILLQRHPVQRQLLEDAVAYTLDDCEAEVLYAASQCQTLGQAAAAAERPLAEVAEAANRLARLGVIELRAVSEAMARLQHYYSHQVYVAPAAEQTVAQLFESACRRHASRPLIVSDEDGSRFRYQDVAVVVNALADRLQRAGVEPGDRVALCAAASPEALFSFWACALVGAVFVPVDFSRPAEPLRSMVAALQPRVLLVDRARASAARWPDAAEIVVLDDESDAPVPGLPLLSAWIAAGAEAPAPARPVVTADDPAAILHTSGTTGRPKQVLLSHGALFRSGEVLARSYAWSEDDLLLVPGELHGITGLRNPGVAALHAGAAVSTAGESERSQPIALAELVERNRVTVLCSVPAVLRTLARHSDRLRPRALESLRQVFSTGCRLDAETSRRFGESFGLAPIDYYGATETTGISIAVLPDASGSRGGDIGRPLDCIARIIGDDGRVLPAQERGELRIFSNRLMQGYAGEPEGRSEVIRGGWYHTGDLAIRDDSGRIRLAGRRGDFLKTVSGDRVDRSEIEAALATAPGVAEVAVRRRDGAHGDEEAIAFVVPADPNQPEDALRDRLLRHAVERLGPQRAPRRIELVASLDALLEAKAADDGSARIGERS
jgi:acyl-coenzyme A synthetase/AMP-(fatty) acid ligase/SAM-dependent methyltransferase